MYTSYKHSLNKHKRTGTCFQSGYTARERQGGNYDGHDSQHRQPECKKYTIKNRNGSTAGTITVRKPQKPKKKKKPQYNFKQLSNQILQSKTSYNAKQVVTRTRSNVVSLRKKLYSDDYNYSDIRRALIHAEKMTRIAKKR